MKTLTWLLAIALLAGLGYAAAGPFLTVAQIRTGIVEHDSVRLEQHIDFPRLREGLKAQINVALLEKTNTDDAPNPLVMALAGLASQLVDGMVDAFVTPAGLANIMAGETPDALSGSPSSEPTHASETDSKAKAEPEQPFANARYSYDDLDTFSVWVPDEDGGEIRFVLERSGLSWRMVDIVLPRG